MPSLPDIQVDAPNLVDFKQRYLRWRWYGDMGKLDGVDWYTDIPLFNWGETTALLHLCGGAGAGGAGRALLRVGQRNSIGSATPRPSPALPCANGQYIRLGLGLKARHRTWAEAAPAAVAAAARAVVGGNGGGGGDDVVIPPDDLIGVQSGLCRSAGVQLTLRLVVWTS